MVIAAVRNLDKNIEIMLHIAQPENIMVFDQAVKNKIMILIGLVFLLSQMVHIKLEEVNQP